ncbi:hypothetical protein CROQUDRAFT_72944 [Cronartium quercuum f. sp. fusiforme G11]|uniref:Dynactin subunit 6 n=1 Tax=Cronartium quercuum f. sp. fusiforme G11 TaxID=708437 RepID=A0A9P6NVP1_9BASI|nr:hypothetical protein CROQUDRAFT_72944 [Cronartium quercuum f. sp. fusiforme G11]
MPKIENKFTFHPTAVVAQDVDLVGDLTFGPNCMIHPSCTIVGFGPIVFGSGCIVEEQSVICNRLKTPMEIGTDNLFSVGCRVEASAIGSSNVFEAKCKVSSDVAIGSHCVIGAGCTLVSEPTAATFESEVIEPTVLPDWTVIFGERSERRTWSGEGAGQARALHAKHLVYLSETLPKFHRTRTSVVAQMPKASK